MSRTKKTPHLNERIALRISTELKKLLQLSADLNGRSLNSEMIARFEDSLIMSGHMVMPADKAQYYGQSGINLSPNGMIQKIVARLNLGILEGHQRIEVIPDVSHYTESFTLAVKQLLERRGYSVRLVGGCLMVQILVPHDLNFASILPAE